MADRAYQFFQSQMAGKVKEIYDYSPTISGTGDFVRLSGINVLINSLRNLLLTPLGYYPFDPEYGSLLYKKLFEMSDSITEREIKYEVNERVKRYDPRIKITEVVLVWSSDRKTARVDVNIDRDGVTGKVSTLLSAQKTMFGLEDEISAENTTSNQFASSGAKNQSIRQIYENSATEQDFINTLKEQNLIFYEEEGAKYWDYFETHKSA